MTMSVFIAMLYLRYIFDCHIKYSVNFHRLHIPLCLGWGILLLSHWLPLLHYLCIISLFIFSVTVTQTLQSSYGISWRLGNFSPCQWDYYDYPHFTGWEAEKEMWQNALSGRKMLVCMQSYHSQFCISSFIYAPNSLLRPEGVRMCLGGILS